MNYEPRIAIRRRALQIRGADYSISEWGDPSAPMFFYLHGWADTSSTFQFAVDALQSEWFVVAPDWRGFGRTQHAASSYWFPNYVADLHSIIESYAANKAVRVVGHSMGGNIATMYAGAMPERVSAFVNLEGFGLKDSNPDDAPKRLREWIAKSIIGEKYSEYADFESLAKKIQRRSEKLTLAQAHFVAQQWARQDDDGVIRLRADAKHKLPNPVLYRRAEAEACAQAISANTLLISGSKSPFGAHDSVVPPLAPKHHEAVVVDDVGHMLHFEAAPTIAHHIERFFNKTL